MAVASAAGVGAAKPKTCSTWSCWEALRYRSQCTSSKHRWDARSQISTKHRMCCQQMIPKRRRAVCDGELHTTSFAICNALGATAAHSIHCSTNRDKVAPDDRDAAATARPSVQHTDLCTLAEHQPRTGVAPSVHPIAGVETDTVLHCLVHLREPARRRCIQLRRSSAESTWSSSSGKENSMPRVTAPAAGHEAL